MKWSKAHNVYRAQQSIDILIALKTCADNSKYLLPSRYEADAPMSRVVVPIESDLAHAEINLLPLDRQYLAIARSRHSARDDFV
jgi:hypothetical protein